jgi:hypothetical protein
MATGEKEPARVVASTGTGKARWSGPSPIRGSVTSPATTLVDMQLGELAVHGWDLAPAIGADETLDPDVVAVL